MKNAILLMFMCLLMASCSISTTDHYHYHMSEPDNKIIIPDGGSAIIPIVPKTDAPGTTSHVTVGPGDYYKVDQFGSSMQPTKDEMSPSTSNRGNGLIWQSSSTMRSGGLMNKVLY